MVKRQLLNAGRTADILLVDDEWVLRRMRDGSSVERELEVMSHVETWGFPVPRRKDRSTEADRAEMVLERLEGPTLAAAMIAGSMSFAEGARILADLLSRLHAIPAWELTPPTHRIIHLDLHPENIILTARGPVVIDWTNATTGPPGVDRAMSGLILAQVALTIQKPHAEAVRSMLSEFLSESGRIGGISDRDLNSARDRRGADPNLTPEERDILAAATAMVKPTAATRH